MDKCPFSRAILSRYNCDPTNLNSSITNGAEILSNYFYIGLHIFYFSLKTESVARHGSGLCLSAYRPSR